jgi:organic hydroperoxide reductase OsmC/OhrA
MKFIHHLQPLGKRKQKIQKVTTLLQRSAPAAKYKRKQHNIHLVTSEENPQQSKAILAQFSKICCKSNATQFKLVIGDLIAQWLQNPNVVPPLST